MPQASSSEGDCDACTDNNGRPSCICDEGLLSRLLAELQPLAPKSGAYCTLTCRDYCEQPDRKDGLSGSVGSEGAEVGFRSAFDLISKAKGQVSGVPYGEDRPPQVLPRDFLGIDKLPLNGDEMRSRSLK